MKKLLLLLLCVPLIGLGQTNKVVTKSTYENGNIKKEEVYQDTSLVEIRYYYENGNLKKSLEYIQKSEAFFNTGSHIFYDLQKTKFYALYYGGRYTDSYELAETICKQPQAMKTPIQQAQWNYWLAVCYFNKGEYKNAQNLLNKVQELKKDKEGWDFSIRTLSIACSIELEEYLKSDNQIDVLRNFYYTKQGLGARNNTILKILFSLEDEYNFKKVYDKHFKLFTKIEKQQGWYKWEIKTPELFLFHQWFISKLKGKPYQAIYTKLISLNE